MRALVVVTAMTVGTLGIAAHANPIDRREHIYREKHDGQRR